ncbi:MAG: hypothetical protein OMM_13506, partial [Candidatus Magnetoglobus multicellularis str. Araruama]
MSLSGVAYGSSALGDYNNDGLIDILLTGSFTAKVYQNTGDAFSEDTDITLPGIMYATSVFFDYDNDGDLDILITGDTLSNYIAKVYRNTDGNFSEDTGITLIGVKDGSSTFGDYDNDGDLDILITGNSESGHIARLYRNTDGNFSEDTDVDLTGVNYSSSAFGDYDNDGDIDILITGESEGVKIARLYKNYIDISNLPPSEPTALNTVVTGQNVLLSWSAASDAETISSAGLNYNLRIGSTSGASDILAPMALPLSSGYRLIPERGMIQNLTATVNLPDGTYYWSVQAIDTAFAGSEFATEASFAIGSPEISIISNQSISEDTSIDSISFMITDTNASPCSLTITFDSSNTVLIPTENISYTCNSGYYTLTVNPELNQSGTSILTVMAMNPYGNTATSSFSLTVTEVNDAPQISSISDQS